MKILEPDYSTYQEAEFDRRSLVRDFGDCVVWSAEAGKLLLILDAERERRVAIFEYDSAAERERDIRLVKIIPEGGGGAAAIGAALKPVPPSRPATHANPLPSMGGGTD